MDEQESNIDKEPLNPHDSSSRKTSNHVPRHMIIPIGRVEAPNLLHKKDEDDFIVKQKITYVSLGLPLSIEKPYSVD